MNKRKLISSGIIILSLLMESTFPQFGIAINTLKVSGIDPTEIICDLIDCEQEEIK